MAHRLVVLEWLFKADQDFGFARLSLENTTYYDHICFAFHQAAEKYLKAYIVKFDLEFKKLHDLVKLLKTCSKNDRTLETVEKSCRFLTPFYFETRYADNVFAVCTKKQAEEAYHHTEKIQSLIRKKLGISREVTLEELKKENEKVDKILRGSREN